MKLGIGSSYYSLFLSVYLRISIFKKLNIRKKKKKASLFLKWLEYLYFPLTRQIGNQMLTKKLREKKKEYKVSACFKWFKLLSNMGLWKVIWDR